MRRLLLWFDDSHKQDVNLTERKEAQAPENKTKRLLPHTGCRCDEDGNDGSRGREPSLYGGGDKLGGDKLAGHFPVSSPS